MAKVCIPIVNEEGLDSSVYDHFGSAPLFLIADSESGSFQIVDNGNTHHEHGQCNPIQALGENRVDAVLVGGIGQRAISRLGALGIRVFRTEEPTAGGNLELFKDGKLAEFTMEDACSHNH